MVTTSYIPGLKPGSGARNVLVGTAYLVVFTVVLPTIVSSYRPIRGC